MGRSTPFFDTPDNLTRLISKYFTHIQGKLQPPAIELKAEKNNSGPKIWERDPEPPTITGLALFLGFNSRKEFDAFERKRRYSAILKRGRLLIEAAYEKKLHQQPASGAIFALKSMGWNEQPEVSTAKKTASKNIKVEIVETGPLPVGAEKDVTL